MVWQEEITPVRFAGQTVVVTGAASGIGKATALRVAREGGAVVATDRSSDLLEALAGENPELGFITVSGDITAEETVRQVVEAARGRIDALANVAGIMDSFQPVHERNDETWDLVFNVNVTSLMRLMRAAVPLMLEAGYGSVVNVTSEAGLRGSAAGAAYTASKHAVIGLTRGSAVMHGRKGSGSTPWLRAGPGPTLTPSSRHSWGRRCWAPTRRQTCRPLQNLRN